MIYTLILCATIGQINTSGLTPSQKAQVQFEVAEMLEENGQDKSAQNQVEKAKEWAELGQQVGVALVATAKELGIAVEDFSHTTIGKVTIGIIVWKLMGKEILRGVVGFLFLVVGIWMWRHYFNKLCVVKSISYHSDGKVAEIINRNSHDNEGLKFLMLCVLICVVATGMLVMLL